MNPYDWLNSFISCDWYCGPLSLINSAGIPCLENTALIIPITADVVVVASLTTSRNLEK